LAEAGMRLAIGDISQSSLDKSSETLSNSVSADNLILSQVDVTSLDSLQSFKKQVLDKFKRVDLLHLNAGTGMPSSCFKNIEAWHKTLGVNFHGVLNGAQTFVEDMIADRTEPGLIIVTGSKQGITAPPGNPAYNVSKAAVKTYAEALAHEMRNTNDKVDVRLLVPGWVYTKLTTGGEHPDMSKKPAGAWTPDECVDYLWKKLDTDQFYIICPDNDVTEAMDEGRMAWSASDPAEKRPPLSRWHPEYADAFKAHMEKYTKG